MSITPFVSVCAMAALLSVGCNTVHSPFIERHTSEGWRVCGLSPSDPHYWTDPHFGWNLDKAITEDYRSYIQNLSREERLNAYDSNIRLLEDGTGKHAITISIPLSGWWASVWWEHVLVYDTNNMRIKTLKYKSGHSIR